jgi:hypothetical protein
LPPSVRRRWSWAPCRSRRRTCGTGPLTPAGLRQLLHRAREKFADLLFDEVVQALEAPTPEQIEEELLDLGLLYYCRPALDRLANRAKESPNLN